MHVHYSTTPRPLYIKMCANCIGNKYATIATYAMGHRGAGMYTLLLALTGHAIARAYGVCMTHTCLTLTHSSVQHGL